MSQFVEPLEFRSYLSTGGTADRSFGDAGVVNLKVPITKNQTIAAVALATDSIGRVYVTSDVRTDGNLTAFVVQRLSDSGAVDPTWAVAKHGRLKFGLAEPGVIDSDNDTSDGHGVVIDAADRVLVQSGATVERYTPDGTPDTAFGKNGTLKITGFTHVRKMVTDATNKIYAAGDLLVGGESVMRVARFQSRGRPDRAYADHGVYNAPRYGRVIRPNPGAAFQKDQLRGVNVHEAALAVAADGSLTIAGNATFRLKTETDLRYGVQAVRLKSDGTPDHTYGLSGVADKASASNGSIGLFVTFESVAGMRPDGAVILLETGYDYDDGYFNLAFSPTAKAENDGIDFSDFHVAGQYETATNIEYFGTPGEANGVLVNHYLTRFKADGSEDPDFTAQVGEIGTLADVARSPDGTLVLATDPVETSEYHTVPRVIVQIRRLFYDSRPVATLRPRTFKSPTAARDFTVTYRGPKPLDAATIDGDELTVTGPDGKAASVRLVSKQSLSHGRVVATYRLTGGGNGSYAVALKSGSAADSAGSVVGDQTLGVLRVKVA